MKALELSGTGYIKSDMLEGTFCVLRLWSECCNLNQMDFKMEAKGVTPIPAPTSTATSYWKMSSLAVPKGPSTSILAERRRQHSSEVSPPHPTSNILPQTTAPTADFCLFQSQFILPDQSFSRELFSLLSVYILVWVSADLKDLPGNWWILLFKCPYEIFCPIPCCSDMDGEEIFFWSRGQSKRMPLQERDWGAINKDVLSHFHAKATLLHLQFQNFGWVHDNLWRKHIDQRRQTQMATKASI